MSKIKPPLLFSLLFACMFSFFILIWVAKGFSVLKSDLLRYNLHTAKLKKIIHTAKFTLYSV